MKKIYFLLFSIVLIGLSACKKDKPFDPVAQAAKDDADIQAYMTSANITATKDPSGIYYQVLTPGTGDYPNVNSVITVNYTGKLLNGTVFDTGSLKNQKLSGVIEGWKIGIPHINTGGRLLLLVPSALGYGNSPYGSIPANSVLIFTIDLTGFNN